MEKEITYSRLGDDGIHGIININSLTLDDGSSHSKKMTVCKGNIRSHDYEVTVNNEIYIVTYLKLHTWSL